MLLLIDKKSFSLQEGRWINGDPVTYNEWYNPDGPAEINIPPLEEAQTVGAHPNEYHNCTAMITMLQWNTERSTYWIHVPCDKKFKHLCVICKSIQQVDTCKKKYDNLLPKLYVMPHLIGYKKYSELIPGEWKCPDGWNYIEGRCYRLVTSPNNITEEYSCDEANKACMSFSGTLADINNVKDIILSYLKVWLHVEAYGAVWLRECHVIAPNIFYKKSPARDRKFTYYQNTPIDIDVNILNGLCETSPEHTQHYCKDTHQFKCTDGTCVLDHHVCDGRTDCVDGSDEVNCTCGQEDRYLCADKSGCISASKYCDQIRDCPDGSDENCNIDNPVFDSENIQNTDNDMNISDWQDINYRRGEWRGLYQNYTNYKPYCSNTTHVRCFKEEPKCIPRHLACIYMTDHNNQVKYCASGIHLQQCKDFQCPNMFKCPNSYCVSYSKLCNGVNDCMGGSDEQNCSNVVCPGLFKCRFDNICIDQNSRCDGIIDCPKSQDDELLCQPFYCPTNCSCYERSVDCSGRDILYIPHISTETRSLNLSLNSIDLNSVNVSLFPYLMAFLVRHCSLKIIPDYFLANFPNIITLDLSYNQLQNLSANTFSGLRNLKNLIISNNFITIIFHKMFQDLHSMELLDLRNNFVQYIDENVFHHTAIDTIKVDEFRYCCLAPSANCVAPIEVFSSCNDLISSPVLRIMIWVLGTLSLVGNILVTIWRIVYRAEDHNNEMIISLSMADLLLGCYLFIIAGVDLYYRDRYAQNSKIWQGTSLCKICGFLSTLSSQASVGQLIHITVNRWFAVNRPFVPSLFNLRRNRIVSATNWMIFLVLSVIPFGFPSYFGDQIINNGACLFFNFTSGHYQGWEFMTFSFLSFNALAFIMMAVAYSWMYISMHRSRHAAGRTCSLSERILTRKMTLLVFTDGVCWIPLIVTGILGLCGQQIDPQWSVWLALFILPLNAALNPFLYSYTTISRFYKKKKEASKEKK